MDNVETFRQWLGKNLAQLSFAERQAIAQRLINKVLVTGEAVDIQFVLPFESTPRVASRLPKEPEGPPGHFYRLRLAHFHKPPSLIGTHDLSRCLLVQIGHLDFGMFRAEVTPFFTQDHGDVADVAQTQAFAVYPESFTALHTRETGTRVR